MLLLDSIHPTHDTRRTNKIFVLTDEVVAPLWLVSFKEKLAINDAIDIIVPAGESHKNLDTVQLIWSKLIEHHADRQSLLYNLGGGTVTDLGGFAASCFKRGIDFVNVPTTLLAMVDAAHGGKTGFDFGGLKNQIGTFTMPKDVLLFSDFLTTLPSRDIRSGLAEMIKYGFIAEESLLNADLNNYINYIDKAVEIKQMIVAKDPFEKNCFPESLESRPATYDSRLILNFGHTIGHAIESHCLQTEHPLRHGEAVALGMWCALGLSTQYLGLPKHVLTDFESALSWILEESEIQVEDIDADALLPILMHDKKTIGDIPRFVLLSSIGRPVVHCEVSEQHLRECLAQLQDCLSRLFKLCR